MRNNILDKVPNFQGKISSCSNVMNKYVVGVATINPLKKVNLLSANVVHARRLHVVQRLVQAN